MHGYFRLNNFETPSSVKSINSFDVGRPKYDFYFGALPEGESGLFMFKIDKEFSETNDLFESLGLGFY